MNPIFVEFEERAGDKIVVNLSMLQYVVPCRDVNDNHTMIYLRDFGIAVNESYADVCGKIRNALDYA